MHRHTGIRRLESLFNMQNSNGKCNKVNMAWEEERGMRLENAADFTQRFISLNIWFPGEEQGGNWEAHISLLQILEERILT